MSMHPRSIAFAATAAALAIACSSPPEIAVESQAAADPAPMQAAHESTPASGLPDGHPSLDLPAGHPPATAGAMPGSASLLPPVDPDAGAGASGLAWTTPEGWVSEPPANTMRRAQYRIPGPGGEGECVVFYFGPGQGGEPMDNATRWASQFVPEGGGDPVAAMKTSMSQVGEISILRVEAAGTYQSGSMMGMGSGVAKSDWALLGAIAEGPDANWFFKFTGPEATLEAQRAAFDAMVGSLRRGG